MKGMPAWPSAQPSDVELRTLGALLLQSVRDAWYSGHDRVRFRTYCIEARRVDAADGSHPRLLLTLRASGMPGAPDRLFAAVARFPAPGTPCNIHLECVRQGAARRTESPVGCVSPIDARNASPEAGHFS